MRYECVRVYRNKCACVREISQYAPWKMARRTVRHHREPSRQSRQLLLPPTTILGPVLGLAEPSPTAQADPI